MKTTKIFGIVCGIFAAGLLAGCAGGLSESESAEQFRRPQQPAKLDRAQKRPKKCPFCGSTDIVPILYGDGICPEDEDSKFIPGGCIVTAGGPVWGCWDCRAELYEKRQQP